MESNIEKAVQKAKDKIPYEYTLSLGELVALHDASQADVFMALIKAYEYGFCRGTRAYKRKRVPML